MPQADVTPLYVRLPRGQAEQLDRAAFEARTTKREIITGLVASYLGERVPLPQPTHPEAPPSAPEAVTLGHLAFRSVEPPDVLTVAQAAELLQVDEPLVRGLLESGELPGRRVGDEWRLARRAVLDWLAAA